MKTAFEKMEDVVKGRMPHSDLPIGRCGWHITGNGKAASIGESLTDNRI